MTDNTAPESGRDAFDGWLQPRTGSGDLTYAGRHATKDGFEWTVDFGSASKYLMVSDEVLGDPYLLRLATMRLERSGWADEPETDDLIVTASWALGSRPQLKWVNPEDEITYGVTFWGSQLRERDKASFTPISEEGEARVCPVCDEDSPLSPVRSDPALDEKLLRILMGAEEQEALLEEDLVADDS